MFAVSRSQNRFLKNAKSTPTMTATIATTYSATATGLLIPACMAAIVKEATNFRKTDYISSFE